MLDDGHSPTGTSFCGFFYYACNLLAYCNNNIHFIILFTRLGGLIILTKLDNFHLGLNHIYYLFCSH